MHTTTDCTKFTAMFGMQGIKCRISFAFHIVSQYSKFILFLLQLGKWNKTTDVAVKTLKPGTMSASAFLEEATIMKKCRHDKLVRLYAVCTNEEPMYIVTELLKDSLLNYLREGDGRHLKFADMVDIAGQVCIMLVKLFTKDNLLDLSL